MRETVGTDPLFPAWAGHWRGSNGTQETVICGPSYTTKWNLEALCAYGYTVAGGNANAYFGSDMLHRYFHVPTFTDGVIDHYVDDYTPVLELARTNPEVAVRNSDSLQYFAVDVYAYDIALPGRGCTGEAPPAEESSASTYGAATTTTETMAEPSSSATPSSAYAEAQTTTAVAAEVG